MPGGSTLGSISNTQVPLMTVDIGMAQLAMHSCYETAGARDTDHLIHAMNAFYAASLTSDADGVYRLK
jgi:aspartyl aminopeptidase